MAEAELNGLRPAKIQAILDSMKNDPEVLKAVTGPWKTRVVWQSGFKTKSYMRKHVVEMDEPEGLDAADFHRREVKLMYTDATDAHFLDQQDYNQYSLPLADLRTAHEGWLPGYMDRT